MITLWPFYHARLSAFRPHANGVVYRHGVIYSGSLYRFDRLVCRVFGFIIFDAVLCSQFDAESHHLTGKKWVWVVDGCYCKKMLVKGC